MEQLAAWTTAYASAGATSTTTTVPQAIPAGSLVVVAYTHTGTGTVSGVSDSRGNTWDYQHQTPDSTLSAVLAISRLTTGLQEGDVITFTTANNTSRQVFAVACYAGDSIGVPAWATIVGGSANSISTSVQVPGAERVRVFGAHACAMNGHPQTASTGSIVVQDISTQGAGDRAVALVTSEVQAESATLTTALSATVFTAGVSGGVAVDPQEVVPEGDGLPVMLSDGVEGRAFVTTETGLVTPISIEPWQSASERVVG